MSVFQPLSAEDLRIVADSADRLFEAKAGLAEHRRLRDEKIPEGYDRDLWSEMAEMGWLAMPWSEEAGGLAVGYSGLFEIARRAGARLVCSPMVETIWSCGSILGRSPAHLPLLSQLAEGSLRCALALDEGVRHDPSRIAVRADRDGDGFVVSGSKSFVPYAVGADMLLIVARDGHNDDLIVALVNSDKTGLSMEVLTTLSPCGAARVCLDGVRLGREDIILTGASAETAIEAALSLARFATAAEMLGAAEEIFDRTLAYVKQREQFSKPIATFQSVRHRMADMFCRLEMTRAVLLHGIERIDGDASTEERCACAWHAKEQAGRTLAQISREAVQLHGGIAMTDEFDIGLFLKRAHLWENLYGDTAYQQRRYLLWERRA